jgi:hypothetical protein
MLRCEAASVVLLLFVSLFPVLGADEQVAETRQGRYAHSRALRQEAALTNVITEFSLRYGQAAGINDIFEIKVRICFACGGIKPGESIWVVMPGFTRQNVRGLSDAMFAKPIETEGDAASTFSTALWINQTRQVVCLCLCMPIFLPTDVCTARKSQPAPSSFSARVQRGTAEITFSIYLRVVELLHRGWEYGKTMAFCFTLTQPTADHGSLRQCPRPAFFPSATSHHLRLTSRREKPEQCRESPYL